MTKPFKKFSCGGAFLILLLTVSGCVPLIIGAAAGAGGITYVKGALVKNVDYSVEQVHKAALAALKDLELFVMEDELNRHSSVIKAEYEDGQSVQVNIDALTERSSKITIRVGIFGDQEESRTILSAVEKRL